MSVVSSRDDLDLLFSKFAHLYDSGVPLAEALDLARGDVGPELHGAVGAIVEDLYRGVSFADGMRARPGVFSRDVAGIIAAGESRGELGTAARSVADGLRGHVLAAASAPRDEVEALLARAADVDALHLDPDGHVRVRRGGGIEDAGAARTAALIAALTEEAGEAGAFLWNDRLVRVAAAHTPVGAAAVVRVAPEPAPAPPQAAVWWSGPPRLLIVEAANPDGVLRDIVRGLDGVRCVAVGLPVPEVICVADVATARALDPDVVCVAELLRAEEADALLGSDVHALAGVRPGGLADRAANRAGAAEPPLRIAVS
ncbi:MAG: type II secretion system F family protein [Planctomycetota bacterium]|jgi:hypothetical protein